MKRRWTVLFETDTEPSTVFSDLRIAIGDIEAFNVTPVPEGQ